MRLFAGIPVSGTAAAELTAVLVRLRQTGWPVKWVRPEGLHLTVKFLGEVSEERLSALEGTLSGAAAGTGMLAFRCTGLGAFPGLSRPTVLWAGLDAEPALELMVDRVERGCAELGFPVEGHPYRPHVTLGRVRQGERLSPPATTVLEAEQPAGNFTADALVLYRSHPGAGGSRFESLLTFPLA